MFEQNVYISELCNKEFSTRKCVDRLPNSVVIDHCDEKDDILNRIQKGYTSMILSCTKDGY